MVEEENIEVKKVVLVGESKVGKTSIISQFMDNIFQIGLPSTVGSSFMNKSMKCVDLNKIVNLQIWDTAGQERYRSVTKMLYKDADIALLVYDITNKKSFEALQNYWVEQVQESTLNETLMVIVANKSDLFDKEEVDEEEARNYAKTLNAPFFVVSAKSTSSINELFKDIVKNITGSNEVVIVEDKEDSIFEYKKARKKSITLTKAKIKKEKVACC